LNKYSNNINLILKRNDWFIDHFGPTPLMSTYLVSFVVSNLKSIEKCSSKHNIQMEVLARPEAIQNNEVSYGLDDASKIMDYFIDFFEIPHTLPKSSKLKIFIFPY
jgi:aminopeptidase N